MINKRVLIFICIICFIRVFSAINNNFYENKEMNITGKVTNIKNSGDKIVIDIDRKYRITLYKNQEINLGDKIEVKGTFITPNNNTILNVFNYRKYLLSKKIKLISINPKVKVISKNQNIFYSVKTNLIKHINKYKSKDYLNTFIIGDSSQIEEFVLEGYRNLGISHLFAISGMHINMFLLFINRVFKKSKYKNFIIILLLSFFLFITNFAESLLRCTMFFILSIINSKFNLKFKNLEILILCASILLLINPYLIYSIGFLFSFIITFFIILSNKIIQNKSYLYKLFLVSIICFLSSIPILSLYFFKVNFLSPIYNVVFVPIISFVIFPIGIITFIFPFFDNLYSFLISILESIILFLDQIKIFTFTISKSSLLIIFLYYLMLYLMIKINKKYIAFYIIILFLNLNSRFFIYDFNVTVLDVGQADSSVITFPFGKTILIDTGGKFMSNYSIAKSSLIPFLNSKGINKIEYLILTHGDYDHMGEAINLVNNFKVENLVFNNDSYNKLETELIKVLEERKVKYYKGLKELNIRSDKLYFLNTKEYDNENNNSNVLYFKLNNYKFLFMGDAGLEREKDILDKYNLTDIDFIKIGHHGSNTSSSKQFIDSIKPKNCLISVGKNNRYGHPKDEVLDILDDYCDIYRTDLNGSIEIKINKNNYKIKTYSP